MYTTTLVNFGIEKYRGFDLAAAKDAALKAGFESVILKDQRVVATWSPIGGWRTYYTG